MLNKRSGRFFPLNFKTNKSLNKQLNEICFYKIIFPSLSIV